MAEGDISVERTSTPQENAETQKTGLTDLPPGAQATITNPDPVLSEQGQDVLEALKSAPGQPYQRPTHQMTPQAQATLKALRGH
jgi:hypothetical protein